MCAPAHTWENFPAESQVCADMQGTGIAGAMSPPGATRAGGQQVGPEKAGLGQAGGRMRPRQAPCLPFRPLRKVLLLKHKGTQQAPPSGGPRPSAWEAGAGASGQVCVRLPLGPTAPWALSGQTALGALEGDPFSSLARAQSGKPLLRGCTRSVCGLDAPAPHTRPASQVPLGMGEWPTLPVGAGGLACPSQGRFLPPTW